MDTSKEDFLKKDFISLLKKLEGTEKGRWGSMNARQMTEHFADAVKNASGRLLLPSLIEGETLQKYRSFLMSEKPFEENIKNPLIPKCGVQLRQPDMASAIDYLQKELNYFFEVYKTNPELKTDNAFFGKLDYTMNIQLLHKHALHHLRQFNFI